MSETANALKTEAEQGFAANFADTQASLPGAANDWAKGLRNKAMRTYGDTGLPHRRIEEWKYTDLRSLVASAYPAAPSVAEALTHDDVAHVLGNLGSIASHRIVLLNGQFRAELSDFSGLDGKAEIVSLADALTTPPDWVASRLGQVNAQSDDAVVALNTALMAGGAVIRIADGAEITDPIHIVHIHATAEAATLTTRALVEVGAGATATILESHVSQSEAPALTNAMTEVVAGDGARVHHIKVQREAEDTTHLSSWAIELGADAIYRGFQFSTGAKLARNQVFVLYTGEGADAETSGAVMLRGKQHVDTTLFIDHAVPGGRSREHFKAVLDDESKGVMQCKAIVRKDAQKTDGHQMAQALLLSETAEFDSKPELEIFADDVICGHGSTSGQVDDELLFYLRARGIPEPQARALLIAAFVGETIQDIENESIRDALLESASGWLEKKG